MGERMRNAISITNLAGQIGGIVEGDPNAEIHGAASIEAAGEGDLVFVDQPKFLPKLKESAAGAAIISPDMTPPRQINVIRCSNPALGMANALDILYPRTRRFVDVSGQAILGENIDIGDDVGIGPGVFIDDNVRIGRGTEIHPGSTIGSDVTIGEDCVVYPGVHIYPDCAIGDRVILHSGVVIGADGFGYIQQPADDSENSASEPYLHRKLQQIGNVVIEDDVEVGGNSTINRGAFESTIIGRGTKIDDQVMIGHNCKIGRHCIIVAQSGISGSTVLGDYVTIAAQAGLVGHIEIGAHAIIGAQAGVSNDVPARHAVLGSPATDLKRAKQAMVIHRNLPELRSTVIDLKKKVQELRQSVGNISNSG